MRAGLGSALVASALACAAGLARAQGASSPEVRPTAALFSTGGNKPGAGPLDSVVHAALEDLDVVTVAGRPGMDLNAVQLAIDCVGETPACLRAVAAQVGAEVLVAPSLQGTQSELVLSVMRFDARTGQLRRVVRRQPGSSLSSDTLDAVPAMLRELFELPEPPPAPIEPSEPLTEPPPSELPPLIDAPEEPEHVHRPMPAGPWILAGAGAAVIGGGVVFGLLHNGTEDKFNSLRIGDEDDVRELTDLRSTAQTQASLANVFFAVGGAAVVASGIWLAVALSSAPSGPTRDYQTLVVPSLAPGQLGLSLLHRGGSL